MSPVRVSAGRPIDYVQAVPIEEARRRLERGDPVEQIGAEAGHENTAFSGGFSSNQRGFAGEELGGCNGDMPDVTRVDIVYKASCRVCNYDPQPDR